MKHVIEFNDWELDNLKRVEIKKLGNGEIGITKIPFPPINIIEPETISWDASENVTHAIYVEKPRVHKADYSNMVIGDIMNTDFSDLGKLNSFFKKNFRCTRDNNGSLAFNKLLDSFEKAAKLFSDRSEKYGDAGVTLYYLFELNGFTPLDRMKKNRLIEYYWNKDRRFKYEIASVYNKDYRCVEYFPVFLNAPIRKGLLV